MPMSEGKIKVLLIEDDPDQIVLYQTKFNLEGLETVIAKNGAEGIVRAKQDKPQVILLDIVMQDMDGIEVLKRLKQDSATKDIPVLLFTNLTTKELVEKGKELGAAAYMVKTEFTPRQVTEKVKQIAGDRLIS